MSLYRIFVFCLISFYFTSYSFASSVERSIYIITDKITFPHIEQEVNQLAQDIEHDTKSNVVIIMQGETPQETRNVLIDAYKDEGLWGVFLIGMIHPPNVEGGLYLPYYRNLDCPYGDDVVDDEYFNYSGFKNSNVITVCESKVWLAAIPAPSIYIDESVKQLKKYLNKNHLLRNQNKLNNYWFKDVFPSRGANNPNWKNIINEVVIDTSLYDKNQITVDEYNYENPFEELQKFSLALESSYEFINILGTANTWGLHFAGTFGEEILSRSDFLELDIQSKVIKFNASVPNPELNEPVSYADTFPGPSLASTILFNSDTLLVIYSPSSVGFFDTQYTNIYSFILALNQDLQLLGQGSTFADIWINSIGKSDSMDMFIGDPTIKLREQLNTGAILNIEGHKLDARNRITVDIGKVIHGKTGSKKVIMRNDGNSPLIIKKSYGFTRDTYDNNMSAGSSVFQILYSGGESSIDKHFIVESTILPGQEYELEIKFETSQNLSNVCNVPFEALLPIITNDSDINNFTIIAKAQDVVSNDSNGDCISDISENTKNLDSSGGSAPLDWLFFIFILRIFLKPKVIISKYNMNIEFLQQ